MKDITSTRSIGPIGTVARIVVGLAAITLTLLDDLGQRDVVLGLIVIPIATTLGHAWLLDRVPEALRAVDKVGACLIGLIVAPLMLMPATSDATWLWLGASLLLGAMRGYAGCEVLAVSNWLLRRKDTVGCMIFTPIDAAESLWRSSRAGSPS